MDRKKNKSLKSSLSKLHASRELLLLKLELLKKTDLFKTLTESTLKTIAENSKNVHLEKDEILFEEGQKETQIKIYVILSGNLLIYRGKTMRKRIAILYPGQYVGEMAMVDTGPRSATAVALAETILMEISEELFFEHIASDPKALLEMLKVFSFRIRNDLDTMSSDMKKICNFTHDMRNIIVPLGIAEALLEQLEKCLIGVNENHRKRDGWELIQKSFKSINSVKNNMITLIDQSLACVKKAKSNYVKAEANLLPLIHETIEEISCHKNLRNKKILVNADNNLKDSFFNPLDIKRVLQNLIINAGYVTPTDGKIDVILKDTSNKNQVAIRDYGCGIPSGHHAFLLKENFTTKPDGNGFGLIACREIVEDFHNGKIWFDSVPDKGTTFFFEIPHSDIDQKDFMNNTA